MEKTNFYNERGVSTDKEDVHAAIKNISKGIFENSFCKIIPDIFGKNENYCNIVHADGAGTKAILAYLYWKETGDMSVWKGIVQDSIVMNLDDLLCVGATGGFLLSGTIGRNKHLIPGEVIAAIINGTEEFLQELRDLGIEIYSTGGETADLGDSIRTIVIDHTIACRMKRLDVIRVNIRPGDFIIGLSSTGEATYETEYNGGMGSNGLTSARHDMFYKEYIKKYPESFDPKIPKKRIYCGQNGVDYKIPNKYWHKSSDAAHYYKPLNVGKLVLSPTRTYAPIIQKVIEKIGRKLINGIINCTGGAQTKVLNFAQNVHIIKYNLFPTPPLFQMIQNESGTSWQEMYQVFNMGHRMEIYVPDEKVADIIIDISRSFNVDAQIVGHVEACDERKLSIKSPHGTFEYKK